MKESQLREKMEKCCKLMRECGFKYAAVYNDTSSSLYIYCGDRGVSGESISFEPDPVPPEKYRAVFVRDDNGRILKRISKGKIRNGRLVCFNIHPTFPEQLFPNWCDCLDRNHHSDGWKKEWEIDQ